MQNARNNFMLLIFMFMFICRLSKKKKNCKDIELGELEYLRKTSSILQGTLVYQARVPCFSFFIA